MHIQLNSCSGILRVPRPLQVMHFPGWLLSKLPKRSPVDIYHHQDQALESKRHLQRRVSPVFANSVQPQEFDGLEQGLVFRAQECSEPVHLEGWIALIPCGTRRPVGLLHSVALRQEACFSVEM